MQATKFEIPLLIRWSDLDPNYHVRHSVYYDFGAQCRIQGFFKYGLSAEIMTENNLGPILFREEAIFRRELRFKDDLKIDLKITKLRRDGSRFSFQHIIRRGEELCAIITVDCAWMDTQKRKLTVPPVIAFNALDEMPKAEDFQWDDPK